jgi:methyl-accepting chemotaxis protein
MIESSIKKAEVGTKIAEETSRALDEIVVGAAKVTDLISEIASASKEQSIGIEQINEGLNQVDQVTQQNSASSQELAAASEEMLTQVEMVTQMLGKFKLKKHAMPLPVEYPAGKTPRAPSKMFQHIGQLHQAQKKAGGGVRKVVKLAASEDSAILSARINPQEIISLENVDYGKF